ncbi:hypothetical protein JOC78_001025 [Bacillus ectoiniformans]|nr:hypothetical protein [Bacillus ectoiniformans]
MNLTTLHMGSTLLIAAAGIGGLFLLYSIPLCWISL